MAKAYSLIRSVTSGTANQITANGTGSSVNVQGLKNFNLVVMTAGTGTAKAKLEGTTDGTNWYDIVWGTARSTTSASTKVSSIVSNHAHSQVRVRVTSFDSPDPWPTFDAWVIAN